MNTKIVIANWKMNPEKAENAFEIAAIMKRKASRFGNSRLILCPPFVFLGEVSRALGSKARKISLGAQDVFVGEGAAHTGEISLDMLKTSGVKYVIVGHSEKRALEDTDEIVREKLFGVLEGNLKAVLCVGEKERNEHGDQFHEIKRQLENALKNLPKKYVKNLIVAYEPVWAIGKSEKEAMKPSELQVTAIFIKRVLSDLFGNKSAENVRILYGGSVTKNNAKEIIEGGNADGLLVGRESLKADDFVELIEEVGR